MIEWINNFFGIKNEVSVPTLISLIVFIIGGIINYIFKKINDFQNRIINRKTFSHLVGEVIKDLKTKEQNVSKLHPQIVLTHDGPLKFSLRTISYLDTLFEFDFKEIYYSFRKKFYWTFSKRIIKNKAFHKIWAVLKDLKHLEDKFQIDSDRMISKFAEHHEAYNNKIEDYRKYSADMTHKLNRAEVKEKKLNEYLNDEDKIWLAWRDLGEIRTHYFYSYTFLVQPMLELNRENTEFELTVIPANLLIDCSREYFELEHIITFYNQVFVNYANKYRNNQRILKKCIEIIK